MEKTDTRKNGAPKVAPNELSKLLLELDVRRMDPKRFAIDVVDLTKLHGTLQLDLLLNSNIMAKYIKAKMSDIEMSIKEDMVNVKFGYEDASPRKTDEMLNVYKAAPFVFSLYDNVQKYASQGENALVAWMQIESTLTQKSYLEITEPCLLEYAGMENEDVDRKLEFQEDLLLLYDARIRQIRSDENEIAYRWLDKFARKLYREMELPFMIEIKMIGETGEYRDFELYPLKNHFEEEVMNIRAKREQRGY